MSVKSRQKKVDGLVTEAIQRACCACVDFECTFSIQGLLAITVDDREVILVNVNKAISQPCHQTASDTVEDELKIEGDQTCQKSIASEIGGDSGVSQVSEENGDFIVSRAMVPMHSFRSPFKRQRGRRRFLSSAAPMRLKRTHAEMTCDDSEKPLLASSDEENVQQNGWGNQMETQPVKKSGSDNDGNLDTVARGATVKAAMGEDLLRVKQELDAGTWHHLTVTDPPALSSIAGMVCKDHVKVPVRIVRMTPASETSWDGETGGDSLCYGGMSYNAPICK